MNDHLKSGSPRSWFEKHPGLTGLAIAIVFLVMCDLFLGWLLIPGVSGEFHPFYHHDLKKNHEQEEKWGDVKYRHCTNSLGFRDSEKRDVPASNRKYRILVIGDSFTEGIGQPFEKTFPGVASGVLKDSDIEILNAGVRSYSPKLYFLKIQCLLEKVGLQFHELVVFIDISDVQDEIVYEHFSPSSRLTASKKIYLFARDHSYLFRNFVDGLLWALSLRWDRMRGSSDIDMLKFYENFSKDRPRWTSDDEVFRSWGERGLRLAGENMAKLSRLCEEHGIPLTIAVYPWPYQIRRAETRSRQVAFWEAFAEKHSIGFLDYFPDFINATAPDRVIDQYFVPGDDHWNEAGHRIVAERLLARICQSRSTPSHPGRGVRTQ